MIKVSPIVSSDEPMYRLEEKHLYTLVDYDNALEWDPWAGHILTIPVGFCWDGASIPRALWSIIGYGPFHPKILRASLVHDFLYEHEGPCSRRLADHNFREILLADGVNFFDASRMYLAVRNFGHLYWMDDEDNKLNIKPTTITDEVFSL